MVKGKKINRLDKKDILKLVSSYDIYRYYQGPFKINQLTVNKHRGEKDPSLIIGTKLSNDLTHKDFGDYKWRGDCFDFVEQIHNCDFKTALFLIDRDFQLGLGGGVIVDRPKIITWDKPEIEVIQPPLFQPLVKKMTKEGYGYWACYHQGEEDIKRENIYELKEIWRNKEKMYMGNLLTFGYYYPDIDRWKIYRPYAPKREKNTPMHMWKWDTNLPFDYVENLSSIQGDVGILSKSKKDRMVLRKALEIESICNTQAEDPACVTIEMLERFANIKRKYAVTDNDKKGKEFSWWLTKKYNFKHCNVPDKYLTDKLTDFADLSCVHGLDKVTKHFKLKHVI